MDGASDRSGGERRPLPSRPSLEHLKNEAKQRLRAMRRSGVSTVKLADAQFLVARDYGFTGWRTLKAHVDAAVARTKATSARRAATS